jgi:phosphoglycolate phosphatase
LSFNLPLTYCGIIVKLRPFNLQEKMRYKAAIFDLDGTLVDSVADLADAFNYGLEQFGQPKRTVDELRKMIGDGIRITVGRALASDKQDLVEPVAKKMREKYAKTCLVHTKPYDGIPEAVALLGKMGVKLAVLTNKDQTMAQKIVNHFFPGCFEIIRGTTGIDPVKPDPQAGLRIIRDFGITPEQTAFIGDSPADIQTAKACGSFAVGVNWGLRSEDELRQNKADVILSTPGELLGVFGFAKQ